MRRFLVGCLIVLGAITVASALAAPQGEAVAAVGQCAQDCWNEGAEEAGCDPNTDDDCLCGIFFDLVTECTSDTCSVADNLEVLNTLQPVCE
ncbi:hypothetical protein BU26DRAFT_570388 [Trematosphaeria pertusa]|uniref:CFEM domain-containing protein n=1 Tax=Trematosphaeria pertusa TaxID=390896 RepID=A0A6A6HXN3_9PLEO|nr:uncharacterized protein BU26DRAFT_570388 [Trematosphaeria pertusa]KAF2242974.1 hypothetical protein BU26DRAFT_570388 [Trematosphaeria pertusa]